MYANEQKKGYESRQTPYDFSAVLHCEGKDLRHYGNCFKYTLT